MIPWVVPPLRGISVLVTRPIPQGALLGSHIRRLGGEAITFPAIAIEPLTAAVTAAYDLVIFVSTHAVEHGAALITRTATTRIAAVGKTTAAALSALNIKVDFVPAADSNSEALLAHPELAASACSRVLIVRGVGGRTVLQESFAALGSAVDVLECYRRIQPVVDSATLDALVTRWTAGEIDIVTVTSVETLTNLIALLGEAAGSLLRKTPLLVASARIRDAALALDLKGEMVLANGADDDSLVGALCYWQTRARSGVS